MAKGTHKGGKARFDKKKGNRCRSDQVQIRYMHISLGHTNRSSNGAWDTAQNVGVDSQVASSVDRITEHCEQNKARNRYARERRGKITGRRPHKMSANMWTEVISGKRSRPRLQKVEE